MRQKTISYIRPNYKVDKGPFHEDRFNRKQTADQITRFVERLSNGCVISINAPWGGGKTWFGKHWQAQLEQEGFRTIFLDAFERDYIDDPFMLIASEILHAIQKTEQIANNADAVDGTSPTQVTKFKNKAGKLLASMYKNKGAIAKSAALSATSFALRMKAEDVRENFTNIVDAAQGDAEIYFENMLEQMEKEKSIIDDFKETLNEFTSSCDKPVIFIIDELDRCRPDFAIRLIERLKHLFDAPNLVFVLLLNPEQLEQAVCSLYGKEVAVEGYLQKFIHISFALRNGRESLKNFIEVTAYNHRIDAQNWGLRSDLSAFGYIYDLTLRDVEKIMALLSLFQDIPKANFLVTWLALLKVKNRSLYTGISSDQIDAHNEAINILDKAKNSASSSYNGLFTSLIDAHRSIGLSDDQLHYDSAIVRLFGGRSPQMVIKQICEELDMSMVI